MIFWRSRSYMFPVVAIPAVFIVKAIKKNTKDKTPSPSSKLDLCSCLRYFTGLQNISTFAQQTPDVSAKFESSTKSHHALA